MSQLIQKFIDESLLSVTLSFLKKNSQVVLVHNPSGYFLMPLHVKMPNQIIVHNFNIDRHLISLYHTQAKIKDFRLNSKVINGVTIHSSLHKDFFKHWMEELPLQYHQELFRIAGKIIPLSARLASLTHDLPLFISQLISPKHSSVSIPDNNEIQTIFKLASDYIQDKDTLINSLHSYCSHYPIVFKRIEGQSILYDLLQSSFQQKDNYEVILETFSPYLKNINPHQVYLEDEKPCFFFSLNKKQIFQHVYHSKITHHYTLIEFMNNLCSFFNQSFILERCHLSSVYLVDTETEKSHAGWVFHQKYNSLSSIDYKSLLMFLLEKGSIHIGEGKTQNFWNEKLEAILNYYFLSLLLPEKEENVTTRKI